MATSHFDYDNCFHSLRSVCKLTNAVGDFLFVVCSIFVLIRHFVAGSHCRNSCACMPRSWRDCNTRVVLFLLDFLPVPTLA